MPRDDGDVERVHPPREALADRLQIGLLAGPGPKEGLGSLAVVEASELRPFAGGEEALDDPSDLRERADLLDVDADPTSDRHRDQGHLLRMGQIEPEGGAIRRSR